MDPKHGVAATLIEVEGARAKRVVLAAGDPLSVLRQPRLAFDHSGSRLPGRPLGLASDRWQVTRLHNGVGSGGSRSFASSAGQLFSLRRTQRPCRSCPRRVPSKLPFSTFESSAWMTSSLGG